MTPWNGTPGDLPLIACLLQMECSCYFKFSNNYTKALQSRLQSCVVIGWNNTRKSKFVCSSFLVNRLTKLCSWVEKIFLAILNVFAIENARYDANKTLFYDFKIFHDHFILMNRIFITTPPLISSCHIALLWVGWLGCKLQHQSDNQ